MEFLVERKEAATTELVVTSPEGKVLPYNRYLKVLKNYCMELDIPEMGTHGLRHSTPQIYMHYGATKEDLRELFAHSAMNVTERYLHSWAGNLDKVASAIKVLPTNQLLFLWAV